MKVWPEVHWSEGQFLRPHHFQAAFRQIDTIRVAGLNAIQPYGWGLMSLELAEESILNNIIEIRACEAVLPDGTFVRVPDNCSITPRDIKAALEAASGAMPIFFGVPDLQAVRRNVQRRGEPLDGRSPRFEIDVTERYDENTGENPQAVEVRRLRGAIFAGEEDRSGYTCVRIARVERSAAGPALVRSTAPPMLQLKSWAPLRSEIRALWNDIRSRCDQLGGDAAQRALTFATGGPADIEQLIKLNALNELTVRFGMVVAAEHVHPFAVYATLCEAVARISLWDDLRRPRELPEYDHDDPGPVFAELIAYVRSLVNAMLPKDYIVRPFEQRGDGYHVELDHAWFTPNHQLYLGIRAGMDVDEVLTIFNRINFKLASPQTAEEVYKRGLSGLEFTKAGVVPNLPRGHDQHYFRVSRTKMYWERCEAERGISIKMSPADMPQLAPMKLELYVVTVR